MPSPALTQLRKTCLAFPEVREVEAWNSPTFRVKTMFAMYVEPDTEHHEGREAVWVKCDAENQRLLVRTFPKKFFVPPYVGPSGWVGVYLDGKVDWAELRELLWDGWRASSPKKLVAQHGESPPAEKSARKPAAKAPRKAAAPSAKKPLRRKG